MVGLVGAMLQGYTVRIGGSGARLLDAGDPGSGLGGSGGFAFPLGAVGGLVLLTALLLVAGTVLRQPRAVGVAAGGWLAVVARADVRGGSAGDVILANDTAAQVFVYGGLVVAFGVARARVPVAADRPDRPRRAHRPADRVHCPHPLRRSGPRTAAGTGRRSGTRTAGGTQTRSIE